MDISENGGRNGASRDLREPLLGRDCQLQTALNSEKEAYIKSRCRERLQMAGTYVLLIGADTFYKQNVVFWEAEVAIEKKCGLIGVNLDKWRILNPARCPSIFQTADAVFVPFSP